MDMGMSQTWVVTLPFEERNMKQILMFWITLLWDFHPWLHVVRDLSTWVDLQCHYINFTKSADLAWRLHPPFHCSEPPLIINILVGSNFYIFLQKTRCNPRTRMLTRRLMVMMSKHMEMQSCRTLELNKLFTQSCTFKVLCRVWSAECKVWSVKCGVWSVEWKLWSVECWV